MISASGSQLVGLDLSFSCFSQEAEEVDAMWSVLAGALVCSRQARAARRGWQRCISSKLASASLDATMAAGPLSPTRSQQQQQQQQHVCGGCRLQQLSLAHCGVPGSGVGLLAAALSSNAGLVALDLSGLKQDVAAAALKEVLRDCTAAALAAAAAPATPRACQINSIKAAPSSPSAAESAAGVCGPHCGLRSVKVTGEDYAVVDLLSSLRQQVLQRQAALEEDVKGLCKGQLHGWNGADVNDVDANDAALL
jgi:hypothetical protein